MGCDRRRHIRGPEAARWARDSGIDGTAPAGLQSPQIGPSCHRPPTADLLTSSLGCLCAPGGRCGELKWEQSFAFLRADCWVSACLEACGQWAIASVLGPLPFQPELSTRETYFRPAV